MPSTPTFVMPADTMLELCREHSDQLHSTATRKIIEAGDLIADALGRAEDLFSGAADLVGEAADLRLEADGADSIAEEVERQIAAIRRPERTPALPERYSFRGGPGAFEAFVKNEQKDRALRAKLDAFYAR
ncbi:hypothetical protein EYW49_03515 [Siculibacillus lacustris]|uniref:Uncharacterized protein n=1 Tax=Siculibacillus lacustris TaxID=1549641 RepID=A0A4Q9VXY7_9HYPH|nr:hypothetical protein [Siculibacillus lacustris]TBW40807.1 hypothetical protein EYW49_03515 [Siculibacillus lacustris]